MNTLLFNESPRLFVIISIAFGIIDFTSRKLTSINPKYLFVLYVCVLISLIYLYRVPDRLNRYPENLMVSPCDGKVISILRINEHTTHVAIYLNVFDAHVQWCPLNGVVMSSVHKPGKFNPSHMLNKSKFNERIETIMHVPAIKDDIKLVQIAGQLSRRIVTFIKENDQFERGDLFGMIKFGSRVDVFIPHNKIALLVHTGDKVIGNKTIFGKLVGYNI